MKHKQVQEQLQEQPQEHEFEFERVSADSRVGLTTEQVATRMDHGAFNSIPDDITPTVKKIIIKNVCTPFNFINMFLAISVILVGHPKNALFFGVAVCNTLMGIIQELRAKRTLDKLSILARGKATAVRENRLTSIPQDQVVIDDILLLRSGNQVCADATVVEAEGLEIDESLLTGESDHIQKAPEDSVLSGSFVVAGQAYVRVESVGKNSYAGKLSVQAKQEKKQRAPLMRTLNNIIRVLAIAIIPVGVLLFYTQYTSSGSLESSVLSAAAAMVGMIPEGLILLTGVTLTLGAMKLAKRKALVQSLPSIETLARADILCLDKTGTITDGTLTFEEIVPNEGQDAVTLGIAVGEMMNALRDDNSTATALRSAFEGTGQWISSQTIPFSSARKWSAAEFDEHGSYVLGAPAFVFPGGDPFLKETVDRYGAKGFRVLCVARSDAPLTPGTLPSGLECLGIVVLSDTIRAEAPDTFRFFEEENVVLKVISGDDALTVSTIAEKAGISNAGQYLDMSTVDPDADFVSLVGRYTVFGRVTPEQKKLLVAALKEAGHTVCMTGDGVNDVLAMKESDCGVAMINGSEAARGAADFVLMSSDFSSMVDVLREGRRVINNIENVACMYLVKTIYSTILSFLYVFIPYPYPFDPIQMTPINSLTVGIPSFFLALRPNYEKPRGRFATNILENSAPAALIVVINILIIQLAGYCFDLSRAEITTMNVLLTGMVGFCMLYRVAIPLKKREIAMLSALAVAFLGCFFLLGWLFSLDSLLTRNAFFYLPLMYTSPKMLVFLGDCVLKAEEKFIKKKSIE